MLPNIQQQREWSPKGSSFPLKNRFLRFSFSWTLSSQYCPPHQFPDVIPAQLLGQ